MTSPLFKRFGGVVAAIIVTAGVAYAQRIWVGGGGFGFGGRREPPKWAKPANFDGGFN